MSSQNDHTNYMRLLGDTNENNTQLDAQQDIQSEPCTTTRCKPSLFRLFFVTTCYFGVQFGCNYQYYDR